ncbi:hypothetical protein ACP4OV_017596 [Aristida adscensionis]
MECCGRFTVATTMLVVVVLLASAQDASAAARRAGGDAASGQDVGESSRAGEVPSMAAYTMVTGYDELKLPECPRANNNDTKRTDAGGLARRNSSAEARNHTLMIAVPKKHDDFKAFINFSIDIFAAAMKKLQQPPDYELCSFDGTYDDLVQNVHQKVFDGAVGDVTITSKRAKSVDFTMPYTQSGLSLLVLRNESKPPIQWIFLKPLTPHLWLTTVGFFFFTGFVVWVIEKPKNPAYQGPNLAQFSTAAYFAFSTLTFSHGHHLELKLPDSQIIRSPLSKIAVVIWCFAVLVLVQSYTANLSSMLTAQRFQQRMKGLDELVRDGERIGYQNRTFVRSFLLQRGVDSNSKAYNNRAEYAEALRKGSQNGGVAAIVDEIPYLSYFLSSPQHNKEFKMVDRLYRTPGFGFVFPRGSNLVHELSVAILDLTAGNESTLIQKRWFDSATPPTDDGTPTTDSARLTLRNFSGLFVITGGVSASMLLISIARSVYANYIRVRCSESQDADGDGESLNRGEGEPGDVRIDMGNGSLSYQCLHEVRDNDDHGVHGGGRNVGDEEESTIQNGMYNGSVPADCVQIEMHTITSQGAGRA